MEWRLKWCISKYNVEHHILYLLLCWVLLLSEITLFCMCHPRNLEDMHVNHTADALQRLLHVFGLKGNLPDHRQQRHPPQYMLDLYRSFTDGSSKTASLHRHREANIIRSFFDKGSSTESGYYIFEIKGIADHEEVVDAQFHFFTKFNVRKASRGSHVFQIRLYDGLRNSTLLEARLVNAHSSGWEVFKITPCVKRWILYPNINAGLTVQILDSFGREYRDRSIHLQSYRRPVVILFSQDLLKQDKNTIHYNTLSLNSIQNSVSSSPTDSQNIINQEDFDEKSMRNTRAAATTNNGDCTRHELRVDFEKLGWSTWIISPKWYDAYVCSGACAFPLGQNQRPTNHATVQSIVHELGLTNNVGAPCCVPTELHSVSLLYFDEHMNVVLKQYDDMVAAGCGCQ